MTGDSASTAACWLRADAREGTGASANFGWSVFSTFRCAVIGDISTVGRLCEGERPDEEAEDTREATEEGGPVRFGCDGTPKYLSSRPGGG